MIWILPRWPGSRASLEAVVKICAPPPVAWVPGAQKTKIFFSGLLSVAVAAVHLVSVPAGGLAGLQLASAAGASTASVPMTTRTPARNSHNVCPPRRDLMMALLPGNERSSEARRPCALCRRGNSPRPDESGGEYRGGSRGCQGVIPTLEATLAAHLQPCEGEPAVGAHLARARREAP